MTDELKTLKDFERNPFNEIIFIREYLNKRIVCYDKENKWIKLEELKPEVVKWIKEDLKWLSEKCSEKDNNPYLKSCYKINAITAGEIISKWMKRLNLTDEDLK